LDSHITTIRLRDGGIVECRKWQDDGWEDDCNEWNPEPKARNIWVEGKRSQTSFTALDIQRVKIIASRIAQDRLSEWVYQVQRGSVDAIVALMLYQTQNIEKLDLGIGLMQYSKFIPRMFRSLIDIHQLGPVYPNLLSANLGLDGPRIPMWTWAHFDFYRLFSFLPRLTQLNAIFLEPAVFGWPSPALTPRSHSLSKLVLDRSTASEITLERLLRCTPNLKHLVYDYRRMVGCGPPHWETFKEIEEGNRQGDSPIILIQCPHLSRALSHVKDTLEHLEIKAKFESDHVNGLDNPMDTNLWCCVVGRIKHLNQMLRLQTLEISWALLMGWHPYSLSTFTEEEPGFYTDSEVPDDEINACGFPWVSILPPNIQRLRLRDDLSNFLFCVKQFQFEQERFVRQLLRCRKLDFLDLVRLDFVFIWTWRIQNEIWPVQLTQTLMKVCHNDGVECDVLQEDYLGRATTVVERGLINFAIWAMKTDVV
jgi:hypothetical protein